MRIKVGDFVKITKRKCSDKTQPYIHEGSVYHVHQMDKTSKGTTVLIFLRADKKGASVRCNAKRFDWEKVELKSIAKEYLDKKKHAATLMKDVEEQVSCLAKAKMLFKDFTLEEQQILCFVPQIIYDIAWSYADKVAQYAVDHRIEILKKLTRSYKHLRESYRDFLREEFDSEKLKLVSKFSKKFYEESQMDFTLMYYSVLNSINHQYQDIKYDEMRANAFISVILVRILYEFELEITAFVRARIHDANEVHFRFEQELLAVMNAYIGDYNFTISREVEIAINVFKKNIRSLEFINEYD